MYERITFNWLQGLLPQKPFAKKYTFNFEYVLFFLMYRVTLKHTIVTVLTPVCRNSYWGLR